MARQMNNCASREQNQACLNSAEAQPILERKLKDSRIEWIGEIPEHWKVCPHKRVMHKIKDIQETYSGEDIISLTINGVIVRDLSAGGKMPATFDGYQKVYSNNLLLCLFDIDVTPCCVGLVTNEGLTSPAYSQFEMYNKAYAPYFNYLLRYMDNIKCLLHLSKNLRSSLTESDFGLIETILPPIQEQQAIANFLDTKCGEIDELVSVEEATIESLKIYKQSIITETVTRGLNPNVKLKDSGVEWIGKIPEYWVTTPLKFTGYFENGLTYSPKDICDEGVGTLVLRSSNIQDSKLSFEDNIYVSSVPSNLLVTKGDIIICSRNGSAALVGKCAIVEDKIEASYGAFMMRYRPLFNYKYSYYLFNVGIAMYRGLMATTTINQLTKSIINQIIVPLANESEQQAIASYLDNKCSEIDALVAIHKEKIETLKTYKQSMIFEYVTGKKEVV